MSWVRRLWSVAATVGVLGAVGVFVGAVYGGAGISVDAVEITGETPTNNSANCEETVVRIPFRTVRDEPSAPSKRAEAVVQVLKGGSELEKRTVTATFQPVKEAENCWGSGSRTRRGRWRPPPVHSSDLVGGVIPAVGRPERDAVEPDVGNVAHPVRRLGGAYSLRVCSSSCPYSSIDSRS